MKTRWDIVQINTTLRSQDDFTVKKLRIFFVAPLGGITNLEE